MRLDEKVVKMGFAPTKSQALHLIKAGKVFVDGKKTTKGGRIININSKIEVLEKTQYVSRGGNKLAAALSHFEISVANKVCADLGASTGGFTQILIENGATKVFAIDVGTDQLHHRIKSNPRVVDLSPVNLRDLTDFEPVDLICADLSFISLRIVIPKILEIAKHSAWIILLYKPQFEVGKENLNKQGIVKPEIALDSCSDFITYLSQEFSQKAQFIESPITGSDGNQEYLIAFAKK
jgi:23S rRNA (cytidine1920-2'-O)/16S rRNA (cytidine1409-2'-O)-methyltransferase